MRIILLEWLGNVWMCREGKENLSVCNEEIIIKERSRCGINFFALFISNLGIILIFIIFG